MPIGIPDLLIRVASVLMHLLHGWALRCIAFTLNCFYIASLFYLLN